MNLVSGPWVGEGVGLTRRDPPRPLSGTWTPRMAASEPFIVRDHWSATMKGEFPSEPVHRSRPLVCLDEREFATGGIREMVFATSDRPMWVTSEVVVVFRACCISQAQGLWLVLSFTAHGLFGVVF
jgi:hypothetical protein